MRTIYFDYNATTPLDPAVREAMDPCLGEMYGNPSSVHHVGRKARAALDEARYRVSQVWKSKPSEVIFTSGGTESNNMAIFGAARLRRDQGKHLITSAIEHHSVLHAFQRLERREGFQVTYVRPNSDGVVELEAVAEALRPDTTLVSVMAANNETGALQPFAGIGDLCRAKGVLYHCDAAQFFGKLPVESIDAFHADLVTFCAHKLHGPKGAGALFIKSPLLPEPIIVGGGHENERRAGTENLGAILGLTASIERFTREPVFPKDQLQAWTDRIVQELTKMDGVTLRGPRKERLPNTASFTVDGADSMSLMAGLDLEGICASSGSACSAGSLEPSHVLTAMGVPNDLANSFVRFSLGRENTEEEVSETIRLFPMVVERIRSA
ncbi:MAG TPA: cysteine desulfurase family protein [Methylomirabilota bacterium]|nr:cysteine desulfurase family protein [Methylomirabilota bacterium]